MGIAVPYLGVEEITSNKLLFVKSLVAEMVGTLFLVLIGCGSCLVNSEPDVVRIALAFGVAVATMAQSIGHISGCHINPAITFGLFFAAKVGVIKAVLYIVFQCVGALVGAGLLHAVTGSVVPGNGALGTTTINPKMQLNVGQAFGIEFLITFVLVMVVFGAAADEYNAPSVKGSAPLAIGLSITACHLFAVPLTGSSMNPARSFGPAVVAGIWADHWVYWLGPILGGVCASFVYQLVLQAPAPEPAEKQYNEVSQKEDP